MLYRPLDPLHPNQRSLHKSQGEIKETKLTMHACLPIRHHAFIPQYPLESESHAFCGVDTGLI